MEAAAVQAQSSQTQTRTCPLLQFPHSGMQFPFTGRLTNKVGGGKDD